MRFTYEAAFCRNTGLIDEEWQRRVRKTVVSVAGVGGVGGAVVATLARVGFSHFRLADLDEFQLANFNRQCGADMTTIGSPKVKVLRDLVMNINPEAIVETFPEGITLRTVDKFVRGSSVVVDSLDFFAILPRELLHKSCLAHSLPAFLSAPMGFSATLQVFSPSRMSFFDYFAIDSNMDVFTKLAHFAVGLAPAGLHWPYMTLNPNALTQGYGPSIGSAIQLCAGLMSTEILRYVRDPKSVQYAPSFTQYDPWLGKFRSGRLLWGNRGPIQRVKVAFLKRRFSNVREQVNQAYRHQNPGMELGKSVSITGP